ncbi:hypothetical protein K503DRAFT_777519 [Rhizopogon vinicolor AM-OR11-026]|uniref:DUF6534 domain-containing protein n=1 Tax=Rhizopogon vinicolor AM-OR11-026 TaxID=1314800 RepID=A0A1B7MFX6_9AGAM|nr:hypothetical protein K503DRAFT_777519 [Rhizopogon vinicolor AM-OR11-026]
MPMATIALVDFIIASSLCYLLATSRTGFSSTDSFLKKLMAYTINTGCLTSVFSVVTIITRAVIPTNFVYLGIKILIATCMSNRLLRIVLISDRFEYMSIRTLHS